MKILFIGWNENGEKCLEMLLKQNVDILQIIVPKDYETNNMYNIANKAGIPITEVIGSSKEILDIVNTIKPELIIVASFHRLLSEEIIDYPKYGVINVHAAALPQYRGYHPINWAIIKDEKSIGVSVHYIAKTADSGDILAQKIIPIHNTDDVNTLRRKLTSTGAQLLVSVVKKIEKKKTRLRGITQKESDASYAPRRYPSEGKIHWSNNTREIFNLIRSLKSPYPNAFTFTNNDEQVEVTESYLSKQSGKVIGKIKDYYVVNTGDGVIMIKTKTKLQVGDSLK